MVFLEYNSNQVKSRIQILICKSIESQPLLKGKQKYLFE